MKRYFLTFIAVTIMALPAAAQRDWSKVEFKTQRVGSNVYMLSATGGNIGIAVGADGVLLIDDQYAPLAPRIEQAIADVTDKKLSWILNTHWHADHTGGNEAFGKTAPIVAHHNVRKRLAAGSEARGTAPASGTALPVLTFENNLELWLDEDNPIRAIHIPNAHTDGDTIVWFPNANVVHMGDTFFSGLFPFIDLDSGGSVEGLIEGVHKVLAMIPPDATIIPGHGPVSTVEDLENYADMLKDTFTTIKRAVAAGRTADQIKEADLLADYEEWSWGFISTERYIDTLLSSLQ